MSDVASFPKRHFRGLFWTIFFLNIIEYLQAGMIAFAANPIMGEIGSSPEEFGLINAVYASVAILMIAQQHWIVERIGWRRFIQLGLTFFMIGSFICYLSDTFYLFLMGRFVMALGGASFMTSARLLTLLLPEGAERFMGVKFFVVSMAIGMSSAPFLTSLVITHDYWNLLFLLLIPFALIAWILATYILPNEVVKPHLRMTKSSPMIIMLLILGGFSFFYVFRRSSYNFYSNTFMLILMVIGSIVFFLLFYWRLHKRQFDKPLLNIRPIFQNRLFVLSTVFSSCFYMMTAANNYIMPMLLQQGLQISWQTIGIYMSFGLSMAIIAWLIFAKTIVIKPTLKKYLIPGGLAITFYGWTLSILTPQALLNWHILPALMASGLFMIFYMSPVTAAGFRSLKGDDMLFSHAMQLRNIIAQLSMSIGISFSIVFMQWRTTTHFSLLGESFRINNTNFMESLTQLTNLFSQTMDADQAQASALTQLQQMLFQQSTLMAGIDYFHIVMIFGIVVTVIFALQREVD